MWSSFPGNPGHSWCMEILNWKTERRYRNLCIQGWNRAYQPDRHSAGLFLSYPNRKESQKFAIGLEVRALQFAIDKNKLSPSLGNDPILAGAANKFGVDAGAGVYYTNGNLSAGAAVSQLIESKLQLADVPNSKEGGKLYRHYNVTANYRLNTGGDIYLIPNVMARFIENAPANWLWCKTGLPGQSLVVFELACSSFWSIQAGLKLVNRLRVTYSYDYYVSPISVFTDGSGLMKSAFNSTLRKNNYPVWIKIPDFQGILSLLSERTPPSAQQGLHITGTALLLICVIVAVWQAKWWMLTLVPWLDMDLLGSGIFYRKNKPATFTYPWFSLASDFVMFGHFITGQLTGKLEETSRQMHQKTNKIITKYNHSLSNTWYEKVLQHGFDFPDGFGHFKPKGKTVFFNCARDTSLNICGGSCFVLKSKIPDIRSGSSGLGYAVNPTSGGASGCFRPYIDPGIPGKPHFHHIGWPLFSSDRPWLYVQFLRQQFYQWLPAVTAICLLIRPLPTRSAIGPNTR